MQLAAVRDTANLAATEARDTRAAMANMRLDAARLSRAVDVTSSPDVVCVELVWPSDGQVGKRPRLLEPDARTRLQRQPAPQASAGRVYQLWVLAPTLVSVGVLSVNPDGSTSLTTTLASNLPPVAAVAVTAEPGPAGSAAPTMPILLVGSVKGAAGSLILGTGNSRDPERRNLILVIFLKKKMTRVSPFLRSEFSVLSSKLASIYRPPPRPPRPPAGAVTGSGAGTSFQFRIELNIMLNSPKFCQR